MGVIRRQSIKNSIVNYVAVVVGMVNVLIIYPAILTPSEFGQIRYILGTALLIATLAGLGNTATSLRFFPEFSDKDRKHHGFLGLLAVFPAVGFILYLVSTLLLSSELPEKLKENYGYITSIVFFVLLINLLTYYAHNFKRITVPAIFGNLFTKVGVPVLVILMAKQFITYDTLLNLLVVIYLLAFTGLLIYVYSLGQLHIKIDRNFLTTDRRKRIFTYMTYSVLGSLGGILSLRLDQFMVAELLNFERNGVYNISISISDIMNIPVTAIISIAAPLISEKLQNNAIKEVDQIYKKSALNLAITGLLIMLIVWAILPSFFRIMPNGSLYQDAQIVAIVLCVGRLIDMVTSVNGQIISYSNFFRFNLFVILFVAILNIVGNFIFIPRWGIMGAAISTVMSMFLLNLIRTIYVSRKFKIHPFSYRLLGAFAIAGAVFAVINLIPELSNPYLTILLKGGLAVILFSFAIIIFNVSEDINDLARSLLRRLKRTA